MHTKSTAIFQHSIVKPALCGLICAVGDNVILKNNNKTSCAYFGSAVAAGVFVSSSIGQMISPFFPTHSPVGKIGKNLEARVIEIGFGSTAAYAMNHYILKNEFNNYHNMLYKLAIIAGADVAAEMMTELMLIV